VTAPRTRRSVPRHKMNIFSRISPPRNYQIYPSEIEEAILESTASPPCASLGEEDEKQRTRNKRPFDSINARSNLQRATLPCRGIECSCAKVHRPKGSRRENQVGSTPDSRQSFYLR
jgi:hypothetical protein